MYEHGSTKNSLKQWSGRPASGKETERRGADRHIFTASAEIIDLSSGARFSTRTTDLGPGGCFVDTLLPFPVGAKVHVSVRKGKTQFEINGVVVYSQAGLGMGIEFDALGPSQRLALDRWLRELTGGRIVVTPEPAPAPRGSLQIDSPDHATLVRLVQLMISKGILTAAEGASVLYDPVL
jgi:PilZ domain